MNESLLNEKLGHRLLQWGVALFLIGLLTGFVFPALENPRMGLASHLEAVMNGIFLIGLGLLWPKLHLARFPLTAAYWFAIYGAFANWLATLLAAIWGAGSMMPIAAEGREGTGIQEAILGFLLVTLSVAMVTVCVVVLWGLRGGPRRPANTASETG